MITCNILFWSSPFFSLNITKKRRQRETGWGYKKIHSTTVI